MQEYKKGGKNMGLFEDRLLYTGANLQEAIDKAQLDIDTINTNLSNWKGRPICLQSTPDVNTALPEIDGQIAYCNIVKPLPQWGDEEHIIMEGVNNYYSEAIYSTEWDLPLPPE